MIKKKITIYGIIFFVLPAGIIIIFEIIFASLFYFTGSTYFEDRLENNHRSGLEVRLFKSEGKNINGQNKIRVAVFGGSSSAGFGSAISFAELLGNSDFSGQNFEVHNYARSGEPFVGFQAELLKAVMPSYDILVVYAGHNEIWQQIYTRARASKVDIVLPNGLRVQSGSAAYVQLERRLRRTKGDGILWGFAGLKDNFLDVVDWLSDRSRLFWVANKFAYKVSAIIYMLTSRDVDQKYNPSFYYHDEFLSSDERKLLVEQFKKEINGIAGMLRNDQTLILSTQLVNNFFPPLAGVVINKNQADAQRDEKITRLAYEKLINRDFTGLKSEISNLPEGPHKTYLKARVCFSKDGVQNLLTSSCHKLAEEARRNDSLPYRVVPEINQFIRDFKSPNVVVVDPERRLNSDANNLAKYNEYFVDFQHPSPKGHLIIADTMLSRLFPEYPTLGKSRVDECGNMTLERGATIKVIKPNREVQFNQFEKNIEWLNGFIAKQPMDYPYDYFKDKAILAKSLCQQ